MGKKKSKIKEILPPFLYQSLLNWKAQFEFNIKADKKLLANNAILENSAKGKRAFLLATGPSINSQDLSILKGEDCFSLSNFFLHKDLQTIKPKFHFFAPWHWPLEKDNFYGWMKQGDETLPPETKIFLGDSDADELKKRGIFKNRSTYFLHFNSHASVGKIDITKPILGPQTGPLMVLPVLINMGYEKIYLLGCDHTILRDYKKTVKNFYDSKLDVRKNATDANSWKNDIIYSLHNTLNVFLQYQKYKEAIEKHYPNTKIINLSNDSWLDLFEFDSLENVLR